MFFRYLWLTPLFIAGFILVHLAKMMRLYLVLLEQNIPFPRFILIYCKTTFINLIIPFKLGEIYRVYCLSKETKNLPIGLCSVIVDRFFDILALLVILFPFELFITGSITFVTCGLIAIVLIFIFIFIMYPGVYSYLNRYIIQKKSSRRSLSALRGLENLKKWYDYVINLVRGRYSLIFLFSCLGWIFEIGVLWCLGAIIGIHFGVGSFSGYIAAIFMSGRSALLSIYTICGAGLIGLFTIVLYIVYSFSGKDRI